MEKWYPVEKTNRRESPSIRLKAQYQSIDILPIREYDLLTKYLNDEYKALVQILEPHISVKEKEELAVSWSSVMVPSLTPRRDTHSAVKGGRGEKLI